MSGNSRTERLALLLDRQHGAVAAWQLGALELPREALERNPLLRRAHRGVYVLRGAEPAMRTRWMAGVLFAGPRAKLVGRSGCAFWGLVASQPRFIEVATPEQRVSCPEVRVYQRRAVRWQVKDGIPVVTPAQALVDLAATAADRRLERAFATAYRNRLIVPEDHAFLSGPHRGCPGAGRLRAMACRPPKATFTFSELEERWIAMCDRHGVRRPDAANVPFTLPDFTEIRIDFLYVRERVAVEVDGGDHRTPVRQAADALRDRQVQIAGLRPFRATWHQVTREGRGTATDLLALLDRPQ